MKLIRRSLVAAVAVLVLMMSIGMIQVSAKTVFDEPVLLSDGKPSSATANSNSFPSNLAFDGNVTGTRWYMGDGSSYPQSITVDLEQVYNLAYVDTYWFNMTNTGGGRVFGYKVWCSIDGIDYSLVADETDLIQYSNAGTGADGQPRQRDNLYTAARYVKIEVTGCNQDKPASAWEIQVYGYDTALKFDGGVNATSEAEGFEATLAADGDMETAWKASEEGEQSWTVDLEAGFTIDEIGISWLDDTAIYSYDVQTSLDGENFMVVWDQTGNTSSGEALYQTSEYARFVRVTVYSCSAPEAAGIREVTLRTRMNKFDAVVDLGNEDTGFNPENELIVDFTNSLQPGTDIDSCIKLSSKSDNSELNFELIEIAEGKTYKINTALEYGKEYTIAVFSVSDVFGQSLIKEIDFKTFIKKEVSEIKFYADGVQIEELTAGTVSARLTARNNQGEDFSPCLIVLVFDNNGALLDIAADEATLSEGYGEELEVSVNVDDAQAQYIEAYIWNGLDRMSELSASVVLKTSEEI